MTFEVEMREELLKQLRSLNEKDRHLIASKIELVKLNPYRFKAIHSKRFNRVFRVRLNIGGKECRLIYVVIEPKLIFVCLLERKDDYADLEKYLSKL